MNPVVNKTVTVDVREDIRNGREPFSRIMTAANALRAGEQLLLIAPFEPVPLLRFLGAQGFRYSARPEGAGNWHVVFTRNNQHELAGSQPVLRSAATEN